MTRRLAKIALTGVYASLLLGGCAAIGVNHTSDDRARMNDMITDIPGLKAEHLSADFWIKNGASSRVILTPAQIKAFNAKSFASDPTLYNLEKTPQILTNEDVIQRLRRVSVVSKYPRIYEDGTALTAANWAGYEASLNLGAIPQTQPARFALAVRRSALRTYPTDDLIFSHDAENRDIERFQESTLFPGDAVLVLHSSADGQWSLVQSFNYIAWAKTADIAIGDKDTVLGYGQRADFLVVTGQSVKTSFNPQISSLSELALDMGVRVPLSEAQGLSHDVYGQNPAFSYVVDLPQRKSDGTLEFKPALIPKSSDVHLGYLPYSEAHIIRQGFKFLGERYGWGHRYNGRDCTGFVSEIYRTFGIVLPRNSGDQGRSAIGQTDRFSNEALAADKLKRLSGGRAGDLIYIPGHVLILLGHIGSEPFAIHDVAGLRLLRDDGTLYTGTLNGVSVTPLLPLQSNSTQSYLDTIYAIKTLR